MEHSILEKYKSIAEEIYRKNPNVSDRELSVVLLADLFKAGFNPNQSRNSDGTWGNNVPRITVYRGRGNNYKEGENEGFLWVAKEKSTALNYAALDENGNWIIDEFEIDQPMRLFKFPYARPSQYVVGENVANIFRQYLHRKVKAKEITIDDWRILNEKIKVFQKAAGDNVEPLLTKLNKPEAAKMAADIIISLGFDALEVGEHGIVTYGIPKTAKSKLINTENKAGFDPNQRRNPDGTWGNNGCTFDKWFGDSKTINGNGTPKIFYHGTTHGFEEFSTERGNPENDFGVGFYFSNSIEDVQANYDEVGPDLANRIANRIEEIENEDLNMSREESRSRAEAQLIGGQNRTIPVYLSLQNPVIIGDPVFHAEEKETFFDYDYGYNSETDEYGEPSGDLVKIIDAVEHIGRNYGFMYADFNYEIVLSDIETAAIDYGGLGASQLDNLLRESEGLRYAWSDGDGTQYKSMSRELVRSFFEKAGYDGIIDNTVFDKFGQGRKFGRPMEGVYEDTQHAIAFKPNQIKRTDAESFCPDSDNINKNQKAGFQESQQRDSQGRWTDTWAGMKKYEQEIKGKKKENGAVYDKDGNLVFKKVGSETAIDFNAEERRKITLSGFLLTHNHPNDTSISGGDIRFMLLNGLDKVRAVNSDGTVYEISLKMDFWDYVKKFDKNPVQEFSKVYTLSRAHGERWVNDFVESEMIKTDFDITEMTQRIFKEEQHRINLYLANETELGRNLLHYKKIEPND